MKKLSQLVLLTMFLQIFIGCTSGRSIITSAPMDNYQKLGHVEGKSCGSLGILSTGFYFIPMGLNGRYYDAYQEALAKIPGATGMIDVTISEDWYWWLIGTARCVTLSGEAIK